MSRRSSYNIKIFVIDSVKFSLDFGFHFAQFMAVKAMFVCIFHKTERLLFQDSKVIITLITVDYCKVYLFLMHMIVLLLMFREFEFVIFKSMKLKLK